MDAIAEERELLKVRRVATLTDTSVTTVRRWIDHEGLPAVRIAGAVRVRKGDLERFIEERLTTTA